MSLDEKCMCADLTEWKKWFNDNYNGVTEQAKELADVTKKAVKGGTYVPWATMQRMVYQQDPYASHEVVYSDNGTVIHSFKDSIGTYQSLVEVKDGNTTRHNEAKTAVDFFVHMVRVKVTFFGKTIIEDYPIQDATVRGEGYISPKAIDGNLVNNALKRAFTKAFAMVSGLALRLYERLELQFEADEEPTPEPKPNLVTIPITPTEGPKEDVQKPSVKVVTLEGSISLKPEDMKGVSQEKAPSYIGEAVRDFKSNMAYATAIQKVNTSVAKKYGFTLSQSEDEATLIEKFSQLADAKKFMQNLKQLSGL